MKIKEVATMIESIGFPFAYYQFMETTPEKAVKPPYVLFYFPSSENELADDAVYAPITTLNIELYTKQKNISAEKKVEEILSKNGFVFDKTESYLTDEKMFEVLFETSCVLDA
ncbi:MAG: hypothetical protein LKF53_02195 [Solobacterium sp.]|jgi:hypothetical protein|nr:hypothetical protein [Solobacterium sp.]MCH4226782.1 hypothetical protein [Solobacterium sp.]MCH4281889.1 hypothetical protein [Solobacterium sp.]